MDCFVAASFAVAKRAKLLAMTANVSIYVIPRGHEPTYGAVHKTIATRVVMLLF
jgi:hypothetical protein